MYVVGALKRLTVLNAQTWNDLQIHSMATSLISDIQAGVRRYGVTPAKEKPDVLIYAYEVDGLGNSLVDFDDPNIPSLLSIPLLGWDGYDPAVYAATRAHLEPQQLVLLQGDTPGRLGLASHAPQICLALGDRHRGVHE